jgi:hypothetical protein
MPALVAITTPPGHPVALKVGNSSEHPDASFRSGSLSELEAEHSVCCSVQDPTRYVYAMELENDWPRGNRSFGHGSQAPVPLHQTSGSSRNPTEGAGSTCPGAALSAACHDARRYHVKGQTSTEQIAEPCCI